MYAFTHAQPTQQHQSCTSQLWDLVFVQIVFSGVFLLTPGKEAYRLKANDDEEEMPMLSSPRASNLSRANSLHV